MTLWFNQLTVILWNFERKQEQIQVVSSQSLAEPLCLYIVLSVLLGFSSLSFVHYQIIKTALDIALKIPTAIYH